MNYLNKKDTLVVFYLVACCLLLVAHQAQSAEIYFGSNSKELGLNEKFEIGVFINTEGEFINAVEGDIDFPSDKLDFQGVHNGGSILLLWVKQPSLSSDGKISFSGVTPGGFQGSQGYLFSLIFKSKKTGQVQITSASEKILLNDGIGSKAKIANAALDFKIVEDNSAEVFVPLYDPDPPEAFQLQIARDENIFSGKWFLVFNTQDKGSGIDYYEILEKPQPNSVAALSFFKKEEWIRSDSPYLLKDQKLESVILVKAVDRAGNSIISALEAFNKLPWYENYLNWFIIIIISVLFLLFVFIFRKILWRKQQ